MEITECAGAASQTAKAEVTAVLFVKAALAQHVTWNF